MATTHRTIPSLVRRAVEADGPKTWLRTETVELSFEGALEQVERAASGLRDLRVSPGDRVLVTARNRAEYVLVWLALMEVGAIQVPINPESTASELSGFVDQVDPALVITDPELASAVAAAVEEVGGSTRQSDVLDLFASSPDHTGPVDRDPSDVAVMIPTSGTTGRSKLVMQTHRSYVMAAEGFPYWLGLTRDDRLMTSLPLFHLNAPAYSVLGSLAAGASVVVLPRFSARGFLDAARRHGATEFNAIGAMLEILMLQPERPDDAATPLRLCYTGPSPERARQEEIEARFGLEVVCGYALSESPYGLVWRRGTRPFGTLGSPRQHPTLGHVNDARVRNDGVDVDAGEVGELELRNPTLMRGYYQMPDETAGVLRDGWLRTGDLVRANGDDTYTFVGRAKDVIRRRGENLSPAEVESVLDRHPDVAESAVIAVPSELTEDDVKAFVVAAPGHRVDVAGLRGFALDQLAAFKVPRYFEIVEDLPHTPTGRLAKHRLPRERTAGELDVDAEAGQPR